MLPKSKDFCFCTLALGKKYRLLTQQLAHDLAKYAPNIYLVVYTDNKQEFRDYANILAFQHRQQGILFCYHDKRLVIASALTKFSAVAYIDADTRILSPLPNDLQWQPGITVGHCENLIAHVNQYTPQRLPHLQAVAANLNLSLENVNYLGESLFIVTRDAGRERDFCNYWGKIGRYLELKGIHAGEGNAMGLAAAKVGWSIHTDGWQTIKQVTKHLDASYNRQAQTRLESLQRRVGYHYRNTRSKLLALKDFNFYYR